MVRIVYSNLVKPNGYYRLSDHLGRTINSANDDASEVHDYYEVDDETRGKLDNQMSGVIIGHPIQYPYGIYVYHLYDNDRVEMLTSESRLNIPTGDRKCVGLIEMSKEKLNLNEDLDDQLTSTSFLLFHRDAVDKPTNEADDGELLEPVSTSSVNDSTKSSQSPKQNDIEGDENIGDENAEGDENIGDENEEEENEEGERKRMIHRQSGGRNKGLLDISKMKEATRGLSEKRKEEETTREKTKNNSRVGRVGSLHVDKVKGERGESGGRSQFQGIQKRYTNTWIHNYLRYNGCVIDSLELEGIHLVGNLRMAGADSLYMCLSHVMGDTSMDYRRMVSRKATEDMYKRYREEYEKRSMVLNVANSTLRQVNERAGEIKRRLSSGSETPGILPRDEYVRMIEEGGRLKGHYREMKRYRDVYRKDLSRVGYMKGVRSTAAFRKVLMSDSSSGDDEILNILEREYKFKAIIFNREAYNTGDTDNVIQCGRLDVEKNVVYEPEFYIILEYDGIGYGLVGIDGSLAHEFDELPEYLVKQINMRVCEGSGGEFANIPEFSRARHEGELDRGKNRVGVQSGMILGRNCGLTFGEECVQSTSHMVGHTYSDTNVRICIHNRGPTNEVFIGRWLGERMRVEDLVNYYELHESHKYWRRVLTREWESQFYIWEGGEVSSSVIHRLSGGKIRRYEEIARRRREFMSVSHYLMYCRYPGATKRVGEVEYSIFEMDSGTVECYTLEGARYWEEENMGRYTSGEVSVASMEGRELAYEEEATWAKFIDERNASLRRVLMLTRDSEIWRYVPGGLMYRYDILERVRKRLRDSYITRG